MDDEVLKRMRFDDRLDSYSFFYDGDWAKELFDIAAPTKKLSELVVDFVAAIRGIATTFSLPSIAMDITESYFNGFRLGRLEDSLFLKLLGKISAELDAKTVLSGANKSEVVKVIAELYESTKVKVGGQDVKMSKQELWDGFAKMEPEEKIGDERNMFRIALWSSSRICFSALFFAYEDFLVRCLSVASGGSVRTDGEDSFKAKCAREMGPGDAGKCWSQGEIRLAKLIRHSLVHAGGRITPELEKYRSKLNLVEEEIQVLPVDVRKLHQVVMSRSLIIARWASRRSQFS